MKILHLLYESMDDYFGIGGAGIRNYKVYDSLKARHDITLLCRKYPGARDREIKGLKHIFVGVESKSLTITLLSYAFYAALYVKKHGEEFDIIIEEFSPAIPTFLNLYKKKPVVLQIQGYTGRLYFNKYNYCYAYILKLLEQFRPKFYKNITFVTPKASKRFDLRKNINIEFISNGISSELLKTDPSDGDYILYIGRIDIYGKGLDTLMNAYRDFCNFYPNIRLHIAGDGRDMHNLRAMLMDLPEDVREKIELSGWVSGEKKAEIISNALFTVFPSRHEVQSISVLETMACAKAAILSDIPEFIYIKENMAGMSFKKGNAESLTQCMKHLAASNERKEMGKRGRDLVKDLTWEKVALKYEKFLLNILRHET